METHFSILLHRRSSSQGNLHLGKFTSLWLRKAKETHKRVSIFGSSFLAVVVSQGRLLPSKKHADLYTYTKIQKPMYKWSGSSWGLVLRFYRSQIKLFEGVFRWGQVGRKNSNFNKLDQRFRCYLGKSLKNHWLWFANHLEWIKVNPEAILSRCAFKNKNVLGEFSWLQLDLPAHLVCRR